ncbi:hypothetical protein MK805_05250 [Shimazuella sp. AN120528]|uniref:hypothetical protein n=1 Tax=Shimazuella soli TaxID=1892854 RepID=UPI001F0EA2E8|nr:hypothetical protein [Shimazuella soli]MCH5584376.1 hypothetical protein [Shimazuella soli]
MIKRKIYAWLLQSLVIFLFLSIYWGGGLFTSFLGLFSGFLLSISGIILLPFSILIDFFTKRLSSALQVFVSFFLHIGVSIAFFLAAQGWMFALLFGFLYWLLDVGLKWKQNKQKDQIV